MAGIKAVSKVSGVPREDVAKVFRAILDMLIQEDRVLVPGFGIFDVRHTKPRRIVTPVLSQGEIMTKAKRAIRFRASRPAKDQMNDEGAKGFRRAT